MFDLTLGHVEVSSNKIICRISFFLFTFSFFIRKGHMPTCGLYLHTHSNITVHLNILYDIPNCRLSSNGYKVILGIGT